MNAPHGLHAHDGLVAPNLAAATLDPAALARLAELDPGDRSGLVGRVLQSYAATLERANAELQQARRDGRFEVVRRLAHTLKSSSTSVGALDFASLCAQVEAALREPQTSPQVVPLDALLHELPRVARAVQARLAPA